MGPLAITERGGAITALSFLPQGARGPSAKTPLLARAQAELEEYFQGKRRAFDLPLAAEGSAFQHRVWRAIARIPYGRTVSYGELARALGSAPRAVGQACGKNPIAIVVPCHRVLAANARLGGYSGGRGPETKRFLLAHEGALLA